MGDNLHSGLAPFSLLSFYVYQELAGHYGKDKGLSSKLLSAHLKTDHNDLVPLLCSLRGVEYEKMTDGSVLAWLPSGFEISKWQGPD